jgi:hypothetical protein
LRISWAGQERQCERDSPDQPEKDASKHEVQEDARETEIELFKTGKQQKGASNNAQPTEPSLLTWSTQETDCQQKAPTSSKDEKEMLSKR